MAYDTNAMIREYLGDTGYAPSWSNSRGPAQSNPYEVNRARDAARYAPTQTQIDGPWAALRERQANSGGFSSTYNPETMDPRQAPGLNLNLSASTQGWDAPSQSLGAMPKPWEYEDPDGIMRTNRRAQMAPTLSGWESLPSPAGVPGDQEAPLQTIWKRRLQAMETPRESMGVPLGEGVNALLGGNGGYGLRSAQVPWTGKSPDPNDTLQNKIDTLAGGRGGYGLSSRQPVWTGRAPNPTDTWQAMIDAFTGGSFGQRPGGAFGRPTTMY